MKPRGVVAWTVLVLGLLAAACEGLEREDGEATLDNVPTSTCASGRRWSGGDEESPNMHPGMDCIGCHATAGEGPALEVAGTLYADATSPNDCGGVEGVTVTIIDAQGVQFDLTSNAAGNFFLETLRGRVATPYRASVTRNGVTHEMITEPTERSCNVCHTADLTSGQPGRVLAP
jgi:hypothetical protein